VPRPEIAQPECDDRIILAARGLLVVFAWSGDRWTHSLELTAQTGIEIARAVESQPDCDSPERVPSPVYQESRRHAPSAGAPPCVLLTGRLFRHHFSAAVSLRQDPGRSGPEPLEFDIADRCRAQVASFTATYLVRLDAGALIDAGPQAISWTTGPPARGRLELSAPRPAQLLLAEAGRQATSVQVVAALHPETFTQRLRYQWRWTSADDLTW
jgi:hypothetical protein